MSGFYVVLEGNDGSGKTSTTRAVAEKLRERLPSDRLVIETHHPGSTPLGKHLRQLVKYPHEIDPNITIDNLSRQCLYMVDTISFIKSILIPSLEEGNIVLADRSSFVSALAYGMTEGLSLDEVTRLFDIIKSPLMDRLFVLTCPWEVGKQRRSQGRKAGDHFESKGDEFFEQLEKFYETLTTGDVQVQVVVNRSVKLENVKYIDTTLPFDNVVNTITDDILAGLP